MFSGPTEHMPDGRLIFRGPRMATAIHETVEYTCVPPLGSHSYICCQFILPVLQDHQLAKPAGLPNLLKCVLQYNAQKCKKRLKICMRWVLW